MKTATVRSTAVTVRVGLVLGVAVTVCFITGLISHFIQHPQRWFFWPTRPVWLYRVTQGLHVISGIAAIPLIIVKLWSVWPKLFERPIIGGPVRQIERCSILVLVGSMLFQLSTGLLNIAQWYAFKFFFTTSHYAMAYVAAGAVLVHIGVKLPVIRRALGEPIDDTPVWSVSCLFVQRMYRRQGVSVGLLRAAVEHVRAQGGRVVEGYPVVPYQEEMPAAFAWTGTVSAFLKAGFREVARGSPKRPIMRRLMRK